MKKHAHASSRACARRSKEVGAGCRPGRTSLAPLLSYERRVRLRSARSCCSVVHAQRKGQTVQVHVRFILRGCSGVLLCSLCGEVPAKAHKLDAVGRFFRHSRSTVAGKAANHRESSVAYPRRACCALSGILRAAPHFGLRKGRTLHVESTVARVASPAPRPLVHRCAAVPDARCCSCSQRRRARAAFAHPGPYVLLGFG